MKHLYSFCILNCALCITLCIALSGCGGKPVPPGFPAKLTNSTVTLVNKGQPLPNVSVSLIEAGKPFLVSAVTDAAGKAKLQTSINVYSQDGIPAGTYKLIVFVNIVPKTKSFTPDEAAAKTQAETDLREKQIQKEWDDLRKAFPLPPEWEDISKTPVSLTIPNGGKHFTIDAADAKTFVQ